MLTTLSAAYRQALGRGLDQGGHGKDRGGSDGTPGGDAAKAAQGGIDLLARKVQGFGGVIALSRSGR